MGTADKVETPMPKVDEKGAKVGTWRAQAYDNGEVHMHDGDLRFVFKDARAFRMAWAHFKATMHDFDEGDVVVFPGVPDDRKTPAAKRMACDLVFTRRHNGWEKGLCKCGTMAGVAVFGDKTILEMDEFVARNL